MTTSSVWFKAGALLVVGSLAAAASARTSLERELERVSSELTVALADVEESETARILAQEELATLMSELTLLGDRLGLDQSQYADTSGFLVAVTAALGQIQGEIDSATSRVASMQRLRSILDDEREAVIDLGRELLEENDFLRRAIVVSRVACDGCAKVAITIDDGGSRHRTELALRILREEGVTATLFPTGNAIVANPDLYRQAVAEGHELGNHTYSHSFLTTSTEADNHEQIRAWQEAVDSMLGYHYDTVWFRPPGGAGFRGGVCHGGYCETVAANGLITAMWSVETVYALYKESGPRVMGARPTAGDVARYILRQSGEGSIILLHFSTLDIAALRAVIRGLREMGLEPVTLTELVNSVPLDG